MYYPCSENKGADQPLFSPMQIVGFPMRRLICLSFNGEKCHFLCTLLYVHVHVIFVFSYINCNMFYRHFHVLIKNLRSTVFAMFMYVCK